MENKYDVRLWVHRCGGYEQETILAQRVQENPSAFKYQRGIILAGKGQEVLYEELLAKLKNMGFKMYECEHYRLSDSIAESLNLDEICVQFYDTWEFHSSGKRASEMLVRQAFELDMN